MKAANAERPVELTSLHNVRGSSVRMKATKVCEGDYLKRFSPSADAVSFVRVVSNEPTGANRTFKLADGTLDTIYWSRSVEIFRALDF